MLGLLRIISSTNDGSAAVNKLDVSDYHHRTFAKILQLQSEQAGDKAFLITDTTRISFAEAEDLTNKLAAGLRAIGIGQHDRVSLFLGNHPEMVLLTLAINKLGAIWIPICTDYKGEWLAKTLQNSRSSLLITDSYHQAQVNTIIDQLDVNILLVNPDSPETPVNNTTISRAHQYAGLLNFPPIKPNYESMHYGDTCAILWTSGTTGNSKGVQQSYNAWIRAIIDGSSYDTQPGDSIYCVLPLYNSGAWITCIYRALLEGIPVIIEPKFSVSQFWQRIRHFGATQTFALGAMGMFLLNADKQDNDADNPLRTAQIVPMPADVWHQFEQRFGLKLIRSGMGQSECLLITTQTDNRDDVPLHAIGFPNHDTEIKLFDDNHNEVAPGEPGEIAIKPSKPHLIFNGYFDNPKATAEAFHDDWYLTGDIGRQDPATGAFFYVDRKKDALRYGGRNISTLEVESVVNKHPAVQTSAAFGITSAEIESEQELKLNIILKPEAGEIRPESICAFINQNAPYYFVPRYMQFVEQLPYTPTNKIQKFKLREAGITKDTWDLKQSSFTVTR